jgi:hypothetical protein
MKIQRHASVSLTGIEYSPAEILKPFRNSMSTAAISGYARYSLWQLINYGMILENASLFACIAMISKALSGSSLVDQKLAIWGCSYGPLFHNRLFFIEVGSLRSRCTPRESWQEQWPLVPYMMYTLRRLNSFRQELAYDLDPDNDEPFLTLDTVC